MSLPKFKAHQPGQVVTPFDIVQAQESSRRVLDEVSKREQLGGFVLPIDSDLTAGVENLVEHGLGKAVQGWTLRDITTPAFVWRVEEPATEGYDASKFLALACSADCTVRIEVY